MSTVFFFLTLLGFGSAFVCNLDGEVKNEDKLQVHLVPHTHDDVGWLKTVDEYFYGANNSIQHAGVQYILDSVIPQLMADPSKRFIYVEIAFFERWWNEQSEAMRADVKKLVSEKRLEFINAGWCMNDEAATHYNGIIDQMTYGLNFVQETFGSDARPRIAWHIDPFGHSNEQASIFSQMSFDGFFFGRIDYQDKDLRLEQQRMELVWRGSRSLAQKSDIFTGVLYNGYNPPKGFCYDQFCADPPVQDDPNLFDLNVKETVAKFVATTCSQALHYKTNHIMLTMGSDFMYENANLWYKNLDKLIKYVNEDGRVNAFYSTPTMYLDALHNANQTWELKTDDFFPYADCPHCYWTGYFTSRPAVKRYVRLNNNLLQVCKQLELVNGPEGGNGPSSDTLRRAMAVAQHHDAVTGTEKQHVADDYAKRLAIGAVECQALITAVLGKFTVKKTGIQPPAMTFCDHLNISVCAESEQKEAFTVTIYNAIARQVSAMIRLPLAVGSMAVYGPQGHPVESQILPISDATKQVQKEQNQGQSVSSFEIVFNAELPALGFATYFINSTKSSRLKELFREPPKKLRKDSEEVSIENEYIQLTFSSDSGLLTSMTDKSSKVTSKLTQNFYWYRGSADKKQPSGAYIFRPNGSQPILISQKVTTKLFKGPLVQEIRQVISPFLSQVVRVYTGQRHAEFEYTVGPIPIADNWGKEIISRFDTDIQSNQVFFTDANGREMQQRKVNYRPTWKLNVTEPVAGNYYPVNSRMYIKDSNKQLTILTDRSLGGSSLTSGSMEIMLHRRLLVDDKRGVNEPLNETGISGKGLIVRGKLCVILAPPKSSAALHRELGEKLLLEPVLAFAPNSLGFEKWTNLYNSLHGGLKRELPPNVHLLTLETARDLALIRVEHQYEVDEDAKLSQPVNISLAELFTDFDIESMTEMNLSANQLMKDKQPLRWNIKKGTKIEKKKKEMPRSPTDLNVQLSPMQIRTFKAVIKRHYGNKMPY
ncbi:lysosomal alpha-mannosidase-like isoform X1 [Montipora foliosa]|uniref:lysosomal alpha-mannosidase-like isoform X1 n=1 Tax=Montipora foliosa TaxID=591990 RepID=UPI0035F20608